MMPMGIPQRVMIYTFPRNSPSRMRCLSRPNTVAGTSSVLSEMSTCSVFNAPPICASLAPCAHHSTTRSRLSIELPPCVTKINVSAAPAAWPYAR